jgi:hypothetical protein
MHQRRTGHDAAAQVLAAKGKRFVIAARVLIFSLRTKHLKQDRKRIQLNLVPGILPRAEGFFPVEGPARVEHDLRVITGVSSLVGWGSEY